MQSISQLSQNNSSGRYKRRFFRCLVITLYDEGSGMEEISNRITKLTQELKSLHAQLEWKAFQSSSPEAQDRVLSDLLNTGVGHDLKRAIDLFSQFLWCYIESAAARTHDEDEEVDYAQQSIRIGTNH
jgi:hypothetical protein